MSAEWFNTWMSHPVAQPEVESKTIRTSWSGIDSQSSDINISQHRAAEAFSVIQIEVSYWLVYVSGLSSNQEIQNTEFGCWFELIIKVCCCGQCRLEGKCEKSKASATFSSFALNMSCLSWICFTLLGIIRLFSKAGYRGWEWEEHMQMKCRKWTSWILYLFFLCCFFLLFDISHFIQMVIQISTDLTDTALPLWLMKVKILHCMQIAFRAFVCF